MKYINKNKDCAICYQIPMSLSPEGWRHLEEWHDNGHPNNEVNVTTTCHLEEKKCICGVSLKNHENKWCNEVRTVSPSDKTWEETRGQIAQAILGGMEHRGFYDCGKYLDETVLDAIEPFLTSATIKAKEEERESLKKAVEKLDTFCRHKNTLYPEGSERFNMDDMVLLADIEATLEESSK